MSGANVQIYATQTHTHAFTFVCTHEAINCTFYISLSIWHFSLSHWLSCQHTSYTSHMRCSPFHYPCDCIVLLISVQHFYAFIIFITLPRVFFFNLLRVLRFFLYGCYRCFCLCCSHSLHTFPFHELNWKREFALLNYLLNQCTRRSRLPLAGGLLECSSNSTHHLMLLKLHAFARGNALT